MGKMFSTAEAAKQIGVSRQTLQMWIANNLIEAPPATTFGKIAVRMWSAEDIRKAKRFKGTLKPGPKKRGSLE